MARATDTAAGNVARPTRWMPALVDAEMGYRNWGNVSYWFSWNLSAAPASTNSYLDPEGESIEVGFKDTGFAACRTTQAINGSAGFPDAVYRGVDFTEDSGDAVFFVGDMAVLRPDILANPGKLYSGWWTCQSGTDEFDPGPRSSFNVQLGDATRPTSSFSRAQNVLVPHENIARSFPPARAADTSSYTRMLAPWTTYGNYERSDALTSGYWGAYDATAARVVGGANQGSGFIRLRPTAGAPDPRFQQYTQVKNYVAPVKGDPFQQLTVGANTGFQYEGAFRCRPVYNGGPCQVNVRLYGWPISQPLDRRSVSVSIPNDDKWYFMMNDDWGAGGATDDYFLEIRPLNRTTIDIDAQFVTSGY